jgi:hypothetical protein
MLMLSFVVSAAIVEKGLEEPHIASRACNWYSMTSNISAELAGDRSYVEQIHFLPMQV